MNKGMPSCPYSQVQAKGEGPFALFASTFNNVYEPQFVDNQVKIDCKKIVFCSRRIRSQVENFVNPVTEEQPTNIHVPDGFIFKLAEVKTKIMRIITPNLNFDDQGRCILFSSRIQGPLN